MNLFLIMLAALNALFFVAAISSGDHFWMVVHGILTGGLAAAALTHPDSTSR